MRSDFPDETSFKLLVSKKAWRAQLMQCLESVRLTVVIGQYAQKWHLPHTQRSLTETVRAWKDYGAGVIPLPHPSPRNNIWIKRKLDISGEKKLAGKGVVYCATCDGPLFKGRRVAIIGGGNSALEAAIEMNGMAAHVSLISRGDWTGDAILQDKVNASGVEVLKGYEPMEIHGEDRVTGLTVSNRGDGSSRRL